MASHNRFYPTVIAPHFQFIGAYTGDWADGFYLGQQYPIQRVFRAMPSKASGGVITERSFKTNQQGDFDITVLQWLIGPLNAQTISGTFDQCFHSQIAWLSPSPT